MLEADNAPSASSQVTTAAMATEQPCYTLITAPSDAEQPSEQQLKQDLGMLAQACLAENNMSLVHLVPQLAFYCSRLLAYTQNCIVVTNCQWCIFYC